MNHKVIEANNGEEALEVLKVKVIPDIIVLDLNMLELMELSFLRILKDDYLKYVWL
jgi:CheY-like chemotaxis protein